MGLTHTVSGDVAHFRTPSRVPIDSLKFHFLPKQASGTPSPENPIPIEGWTGLNGRRAGKNIGHVIGYSASSMNSPTASKVLTNYYGTTVGTRDYTLPDTPLVITQEQTSSWDPSNPISYKNGYFCIGFDNLIFDKFYDFSFKITNIIANPLNVQLNDIRLNTPGGSQKVCSEVKNGNILIYKNMKWDRYTSRPEDSNRCTLEFRNCGMSFTLSEIMVTPANKTDGVFEPYSGEQIPITFPIYTKNLFNPRSNWANNASSLSVNGDKITQTKSDDRGWKNDDQMPPIYLPAGIYTISCSDGGVIYLMTSADGYETATRFANGVGTFTIGENVGIKFKHYASLYPVTFTIQIESGSIATEYEPFLYDGVFYGGYYDPIIGELVYSWRKFKLKEYEWAYKSGNHRFQTTLGSNEKANASGSWTNFAISDSYEQSEQNGYNNLMIATFSNYYIYIRDNNYTDADDFVEAMGEVEIAYPIANPIHIPISPKAMQAYLDHNNFWSDANGITEVSYEVTESKDIQAARKRFEAEEDGHHKLVRWNQLILDGAFTDSSKWITNTSYGSLSLSNNVAKWTCSTTPDYYYRTGITEKDNHLEISEDHKVLLYAEVRSSVAERIALYALVGVNEHSNPYYQNVNANEWTVVCGLATQRSSGKIIGKGKVCYGSSSTTISSIVPGTTLEAKNFMMFDLTQMFGAGNEPTKAEFEHICEINGIDLTTYQPYDAGSDRWLIVP